MTIFLISVITVLILSFVFKLSSSLINKNYNFHKLINKSDFDSKIDKSDLISFRHEFGETIFELQQEIELLRSELNNLRNEVLDKKG